MRSGVKILCAFARLFLRLKVSGKEHLLPGRYPSVFVCNHGFIYGPVSGVLYLPVPFRPWIHDVMLDPALAERELRKSLRFVLRIFGDRLGGRMLHSLTRLVCRTLNSFDPVPVVRGASRNLMNTFRTSLEALMDGDNILIFPEKPRELATNIDPDAEYDPYNLRSFYTGFAHIGRMYFDATGKNLLFYPLYSDKKRRRFMIGEPVEYDSSLDPRESRKRLSACLQERIEEMSRP